MITAKRSFIALSIMGIMNGAFSASTYAEDSSQTPATKAAEEVINVTGFRSSLIKAKDLKRDALISRDSILAEDIADFPDLNLADSLQRIPGITITREGGEGRQISLRGLGPDFTRVQVNGMEAMGISASPMDAKGAVSRTRAFDFNVFASELFNQIDVNKTYSADQEEGGIGGNVGLFTAKPFDFDGFESALSLRGGYNDVSEENDPRIAALISNTWGKFGALFSVAYSERHTTEYGTNTTRWRKETGKTAADSSDTELQADLDSGELWFPRGLRYSLWNNDQERLGVTAAFQYQASDNLKLTLDIMQSKLKNHQDEHHAAVKDNSTVKDLQWVENDGQKEVVYASYSNATWRNENTRRYTESDFKQYTLTVDWQLNDELSMKALLGTSSSDFDQPLLLKSNIHASKSVDIISDFTGDRFYGISTSPDFDMTSIDGYAMKDLYLGEDYITNDFVNAKVDFTYLLGDESDVRFGANYKKFENSIYSQNDSIVLSKATQNVGVTTLTDDMVSLFTQQPDINWLQGDLDGILSFYGLNDYKLDHSDISRFNKSPVTEETLALYATYGMETEVAGKPLRFSAGLRYYDTEVIAAGVSNGVDIETTKAYTDMLPTFNLVYELDEAMLLRFGASKNVTRPSLDSMSYNASVSQTSGDAITSVTMGNPELDPFSSTNVDLAFEWYFEEVGYLSAAVFYKKIDNFIVTSTTEVVYSSLGLPESLLPADKTMDSIFYLARPENQDTSTIRGLELSFSRDLDFLPAPFDNLGIIANYTYADGKALYRDVYGIDGNDMEKSFTGLSKNSYNLTFYYEDDTWGARVAAAHRSKYISSVWSSEDQDLSGYHATTYVDFSAFYQVSDTIKINLEGINLTDVREELYSDSHDRQYNTTSSGRTYMLGATVKF